MQFCDMTLTFFPRVKFRAAVEADKFSSNYFFGARTGTTAAAIRVNAKEKKE